MQVTFAVKNWSRSNAAETDRYMELFTMHAFSFGFQYFCNDVFG
jgi:hypothetical protein